MICSALENFVEFFKLNFPSVTFYLILIGMIVIVGKLLSTLTAIYRMFIRPRHNLKKRYGEKSWAYITGSSEGIGKGFAMALAQQGFNIILSARTQSKLITCKQEILAKYPSVQIKILPLDYKKAVTLQFVQKSIQQILNLDISILVNNVGMDVLDYYMKLPIERVTDVIKLNCFPNALLMRIFIPRFEKRLLAGHKSAILNVCSIAGGEVPIAIHNIYSASKAFASCLSVCLSYQHPNIDIMCLNPSEVSTPMTANRPQDILTISPIKCAKGALDNLGYERVTNGYWTHKLQGSFYRFVPVGFFNYIFMRFIAPAYIKQRQQQQLKNTAQQKKQKHN